MAKVIAICGKICAGKTFYCRQLREKEKAVVLSCDELTKALFDNDLREKHDEMTVRICDYFLKKAAELVSVGCNVILDWGFWTREKRRHLSQFFTSRGIVCEWHYIDVDDATWQKNIAERNDRILRGEGGSNYYLDEGLMEKLLTQWEEPTREEINVWISVRR